MALTDSAVKNAKADGKTVKMFDERGLYLELSPSGHSLKQNQGWYRPDLKGHDFTGCGPSLRA
jgi:hypothetical protein